MIFIGNTLRYVRFLNDFRIFPYSNLWTDTTTSGFADPKVYVVQTNRSVIERCILFLGANDPYKSLKSTLKAEINADAWATLSSDTSRPFDQPRSGRMAVKVIHHLGDEVMNVLKVP